MAQKPHDDSHAIQIQAGISGRKAGHKFEDKIADIVNKLNYPIYFDTSIETHVNIGNPAYLLLNYIASTYNQSQIVNCQAFSTGALATCEEGRSWLSINGVGIKKSKSDLILNTLFKDKEITVGVSIKQCNNKTPTNAQLFFTTANGFSTLLIKNGIKVSDIAIKSMRQFCGEKGFRPLDSKELLLNRQTDPRRFFWEEIDQEGKKEWEEIFAAYQGVITKLLLQKAYIDDAYPPDFLLHKTKRALDFEETEVALYTIPEIQSHSCTYQPFYTKPYNIKKGSYKDPEGLLI